MDNTTLIIMLLMIIGVVIFLIVTTITGRKAAKKEKSQRYKAVREEIKHYMAVNEKKKNTRVEFNKVYSRKGAEYKYRDVFDVIVELIEPKTQKVVERRAYEVEGITQKIQKNKYNTTWIVNGLLDLEETERRIAIGQKEIKLSKEEAKAMKKANLLKEKEMAKIEKEEIKKLRQESKNKPKNEPEIRKLDKTQKFVPARSKSNKE